MHHRHDVSSKDVFSTISKEAAKRYILSPQITFSSSSLFLLIRLNWIELRLAKNITKLGNCLTPTACAKYYVHASLESGAYYRYKGPIRYCYCRKDWKFLRKTACIGHVKKLDFINCQLNTLKILVFLSFLLLSFLDSDKICKGLLISPPSLHNPL